MRDFKVKGLKVITSADKKKIRLLYTFYLYWFLFDEACNSTVVNKNTSKGIRKFY
jgi:hypothetical protein